jgi:lysophospholipase L1-like esterase
MTIATGAFVDAVDILAVKAASRLRPGLMRSWVPMPNGNTVVGAAITTLSTQWGLESDYDLVRLIYQSPSVTGYTIVKAAISPSSAIGNATSPVNAAGAVDFTMFQPVFFNNAGLDVSPQEQTIYGSGITTLTLPGNAGNLAQPNRYYSDWMRVPSLARTDGGATTLLMTRHLTDATGTYRNPAVNQAAWAAAAQGRLLTSFFLAGDWVTSPTFMSGAPSIGQYSPVGVEYMTRTPGFSVLGVGDSITEGTGSSTGAHGWGYLSCLALSTPAQPISYWNQGWQGQESEDFWANGYTALKACKPDVATIAVYSSNDGARALTQATADAAWSRAMDLASYCMKNGIVPILEGPVPVSLITTAPQEAARQSARTRMLAAGANGMAILDWEATLGTGASPNRIQPALVAADNLHPNDGGNALMDSAVFRPVLANILRA